MNNDLEQFSEERLIELSRFKQASELAALARIALAAKQAKPVGRIEGWNDHEDIYIIQWFGNQQDLPKGAALYTTPQPAHAERVIPDGWKLVPIEPTEDMLKAGCRFASEHNTKGSWSQMLAAAPKPESE